MSRTKNIRLSVRREKGIPFLLGPSETAERVGVLTRYGSSLNRDLRDPYASNQAHLLPRPGRSLEEAREWLFAPRKHERLIQNKFAGVTAKSKRIKRKPKLDFLELKKQHDYFAKNVPIVAREMEERDYASNVHKHMLENYERLGLPRPPYEEYKKLLPPFQFFRLIPGERNYEDLTPQIKDIKPAFFPPEVAGRPGFYNFNYGGMPFVVRPADPREALPNNSPTWLLDPMPKDIDYNPRGLMDAGLVRRPPTMPRQFMEQLTERGRHWLNTVGHEPWTSELLRTRVQNAYDYNPNEGNLNNL